MVCDPRARCIFVAGSSGRTGREGSPPRRGPGFSEQTCPAAGDIGTPLESHGHPRGSCSLMLRVRVPAGRGAG